MRPKSNLLKFAFFCVFPRNHFDRDERVGDGVDGLRSKRVRFFFFFLIFFVDSEQRTKCAYYKEFSRRDHQQQLVRPPALTGDNAPTGPPLTGRVPRVALSRGYGGRRARADRVARLHHTPAPGRIDFPSPTVGRAWAEFLT